MLDAATVGRFDMSTATFVRGCDVAAAAQTDAVSILGKAAK